jgi:hypothetical protein
MLRVGNVAASEATSQSVLYPVSKSRSALGRGSRRVKKLVQLRWEDVAVRPPPDWPASEEKGRLSKVSPSTPPCAKRWALSNPGTDSGRRGGLPRGARPLSRSQRPELARPTRSAYRPRQRPPTSLPPRYRPPLGGGRGPAFGRGVPRHGRLDTIRNYSQPDEAALERAVGVIETQ